MNYNKMDLTLLYSTLKLRLLIGEKRNEIFSQARLPKCEDTCENFICY